MSWHRSLRPGPVWVTDEELAEQVKENAAEVRRSEFLGEHGMSSGWFFDTAEEKERFLEELPGGAARARHGGGR